MIGSFGCDRLTHFSVGTSVRCAEGLVSVQARCCAAGQRVEHGHCVGKPERCPYGWLRLDTGCVISTGAVHVEPGKYSVGPNDWESEQVPPASGHVSGFWMDATEVSNLAWESCISARACVTVGTRGSTGLQEPGTPVVDVSAEQAALYCAWRGGRLLRSYEWLRVAAGENSWRYPWGQTGLVCRRASFGLVQGPCAEGGSSPEWVGSRPDGKSERGLYDLVGNVREIVQSGEGGYALRGGSYRSDHAAELKSWSLVPYTGPQSDVGFRCAYDHEPNPLFLRERSVSADDADSTFIR
ncbi:MAG TPA: SUMF1/EgtB/PvdO family nonheme iron enzyme [Polyangiaceae bacterium]|nr:SUMF1/EgtB/PvdO family nonheme iron enzyme [Polyangiaceae bacterium]